MNCSSCNYRYFGKGCELTGKRVTDHDYCENWEKIKPHNEKLVNEDIEAYRKAGYNLKVEKVSA